MVAYDERIAELLDRKHAIATRATESFSYAHEVLRFVRWLFEEDLIRPYAIEILRTAEFTRRAYTKQRERVIAEALVLRKRLAELYPEALDAEAHLSSSDAAYQESLRWFDEVATFPPEMTLDEQHAGVVENDRSMAGALVAILGARANSLRGSRDEVLAQRLREDIDNLQKTHFYQHRKRFLEQKESAGGALQLLCTKCRQLNPPPPGVGDFISLLPVDGAVLWTPEVEGAADWDKERVTPFVNAPIKPYAVWKEPIVRNMQCVVDELHAQIGTSLSTRSVVERFKDRCVFYDRRRLREVALAHSGVREDRLTLELAKYLHDNGVFVLVRPRISNLEPDALAPYGPRRLALETKVYGARDSGRKAYLKGFWQLHGYMTNLDAEAVRAREGYVVVFRLGGRLWETPPSVDTDRFRIHIVTIDIGTSADSGRRQAAPGTITRAELIEAAKGSVRSSRSATRRR